MSIYIIILVFIQTKKNNTTLSSSLVSPLALTSRKRKKEGSSYLPPIPSSPFIFKGTNCNTLFFWLCCRCYLWALRTSCSHFLSTVNFKRWKGLFMDNRYSTRRMSHLVLISAKKSMMAMMMLLAYMVPH